MRPNKNEALLFTDTKEFLATFELPFKYVTSFMQQPQTLQ